MLIKRNIIKTAAFIPIIAICYLLWHPINLYISAINLDLRYKLLVSGLLVFSMLWLSFSSYRKDCANGGVYELLFDVFPVEIFLALVFAQYHFFITVILFLLIAGLSALFRYSLYKEGAKKKRIGEKLRLRNKMIGRCFFVLLTAVLLLIPGIMAVFVYKLEAPHYEASDEITDELYAADENRQAAEATDYIGFLYLFADAEWSTLSPDKKVSALQELADYEAVRLGMPPALVFSERIDMLTLGEYNPSKNTICIDLEHLEDSNAKDTIRSLLHEVYHSFQHYVVTGIDWTCEFSGNAYFTEARGWKNNDRNYIDGRDNYEAYAGQPLEVSAREYAKAETCRLMTIIDKLPSE